MESITLQKSLLDVKYDAEGVAKYNETPKLSDETFSAISERLTANFLGIDTKFVSAKVDDENVSSSRSLINPSPVSPSATFPTVLPVDRRPSGRAWAATAPTFSSFDDFVRLCPPTLTPLQLVPLVPVSTLPSQVGVSAVEVAKDRQDADPPGSPDLPDGPQAMPENDFPDDLQVISGNDLPKLPTEELTLSQEDGHC